MYAVNVYIEYIYTHAYFEELPLPLILHCDAHIHTQLKR